MQEALRPSPALRPVYVGRPGRQSFCLFHPAQTQARADHALLICPSFGGEDVNPYWALRRLAQEAAHAGIPAMRVDYLGCGQSEGDEHTPDLFQGWQDSIVQAAEALRELSGIQRIHLVGLRVGALLAALAAPRCGDVRLTAIAPIVSGRACVREMKALHMATLAGLNAQPAEGPVPFEAGGFVMADATVAALSAVDLLKLDAPPAQHVLLIERDDLPGPAAKWAARLTEQGAQVEVKTLEGYAAMMADPHRCVPPPSLAALILPAPGHSPSTHASAHTTGGASPTGPACHDSLLLSTDQGQAPVRERPVFIDGPQALFGILSQGDTPGGALSRSGLAILMLNAGATRAIGPNRLHVPLARHWAGQGHLALRLDIAGLGDSAVHTGKVDNTVYSDTALDDVARALTWLRGQPGVKKVIMLGLCSGAYHGFKALVKGLPADAAIMINPLTFFWHEGMSLDTDTTSEAHVVGDMMRHKRAMWQLSTWTKLLRGGIPVGRLFQIARQTVAWRLGKLYRQVARPLRLPIEDDLGSELLQAGRRKVQMHFVFADSDPGLPMLRGQGGSVVTSLERQGMLRIRTIDNADHTFTLAAPRRELEQTLKDIVAGLAPAS